MVETRCLTEDDAYRCALRCERGNTCTFIVVSSTSLKSVNHLRHTLCVASSQSNRVVQPSVFTPRTTVAECRSKASMLRV